MPRLKLRGRKNCGEAKSLKENDELKGTQSEKLLELSRKKAVGM
jgi:hypothetical protein